MRIIATPLTSGPVTPGKEQPGARTWRWHGKPPGWPMDPATHDAKDKDAPPPPATVAKAALRAARIREFARYRKDGLSIPAAGRKVGVTSKTAYVYERDSKALGEASP